MATDASSAHRLLTLIEVKSPKLPEILISTKDHLLEIQDPVTGKPFRRSLNERIPERIHAGDIGMVNGWYVHEEMRAGGFALVTILLCLALIAVLAVGVFSMMKTETISSKAHGESQRARQLAGTVLNMVLAQIGSATTEPDTIWTSQPGALKTFKGSKTLSNVYKLYSAAQMIAAGPGYNPALDVPSDWKTRTEEFVDINAPLPTSGEYPIFNPSTVGSVDGFSLTSGTTAEMPVRWLYVLADGSVTTRDQVTDVSNPAVARIAFWTDDETCKLNLNTASEGTFWSQPYVPASDGTGLAARGPISMRNLSQKQPLQWEYQRYPGHPATTCLSPVLWSFLGMSGNFSTATDTNKNTNRESLFGLLPQIQPGGSQGGTVGLKNVDAPLALKADRHFSSPDEFLYTTSVTAGGNRTALVGASASPATLRDLRFFLTSSSRSPDINPFKKPKVSMWPVHEQTADTYRTPFDKLSAFASTVGAGQNPFYFTRSDPYSRTADLPLSTNPSHRNVVLFNYLQKMMETTIPGYGGTFSSKYPNDYLQILTETFDYIRSINLTDRSTTPPIANPFTPRSLVVSGAMTSRNSNVPGSGQVVPIQGPGNSMGFGRFSTIRGLGFVIFSEAIPAVPPLPSAGNQLRMLLLAQPVDVQHGWAIKNSDYRMVLKTTSPVTFGWGAAAAGNTFAFENGLSRLVNYVQAADASDGSSAIGGPEGFNLTRLANNLSGKTPGKTTAGSLTTYPFYSEPIAIPTGQTQLTFGGGAFDVEIQTKKSQSISSNSTNDSDFVTVQKMTFTFPQFGPVTLPTPGNFTNSGSSTAATLAERLKSFGSKQRNMPSDTAAQAGIFTPTDGDIMRNLELSHGDYRLSAASPVIAASGTTKFVPAETAALPYSGTAPIISNLQPNSSGKNNGNELSPGNYGTLVTGMSNGVALAPMRMTDALNANGAPGDFDAAVGGLAVGGQFCGPFINKTDDGSAWDGGASSYPYMEGSAQMPPNSTFSSPSRQVPSPVILGSLPTGVFSDRPWQTLLFCPNPASRFGASASAHPGEATPPDHLWLEFFQMPVVEPYAISDSFSTAGKVNMNYQILPFTNIERTSALHGVLRSVKLTAVPAPASYGDTRRDVLYDINANATLNGTWTSGNSGLKSFSGVFKSPQTAFLHASEICEVPLVPTTRTDGWSASAWSGNFDTFWATNKFTADNLREQPYALIYPRLTTRSNTYTIHTIVQTLSPAFATLSQAGSGGKAVTAEFRVDYLIERYLDSTKVNFDFAAPGETRNMDGYYKVRVLAEEAL
jgi:uncharacterized protein (TIGR02600 family)